MRTARRRQVPGLEPSLNSLSQETGDIAPASLFSRRDWIFFLLFLALLLILFRDLWFFDRFFYARDMTVIEVPARKLGVELLKQGHFALWTDAYGNGQPFLANPKQALLYPSELLFLVLPFFTAFKLHFLIHFLIGWAGLYFLGKALGMREEGAFLGAALFFFSGIVLSCVEFYNHIAALSWMPWILLTIFRLPKGFRRPTLRLSWLWSLMILAGTPFVVVMTGLVSGLRALVGSKDRARRLGVLAVSLVIALGVTAAQLVPAADAVLHSARGTGEARTWSLQPIQLFNFIFPDFLGSDRAEGRFDFWGGFLFDKGYPLFYSFYLGAGFLVLLLIGLRRPLDERHWTLILCLLVFFVLALGPQIVFFQVWKKIPPLSVIRYPVKYMVGFVLALCLLAALAFDRVFHSGRFNPSAGFRFLAGAGFLLLSFLFFRSALVGALAKIFVIREASGLAFLERSLLFGLVGLTVYPILVLSSGIFPRARRLAGWKFLLVVSFELVLVNRTINPTVPTSFFDDPDFVKDKPRPVTVFRDDPVSFYYQGRIDSLSGYHDYMRQTLMPYIGISGAVRHPFGRDFYNLYERDYLMVQDLLKSGAERRVKLLAAVGCRYLISHHKQPGLAFEERRTFGYPIYFHKIADFQPSEWLVHKSRRAETFTERCEAFFNEDFDPYSEAVVDRILALGGWPGGLVDDELEVVEAAQGWAEYRIRNSRPAILVMQGNYRPGWKARIDGRKSDVFPVNLTSRGVFLEAGTHSVTVFFRPDSYFTGIVVSLISVSVLLFITARVSFDRLRG